MLANIKTKKPYRFYCYCINQGHLQLTQVKRVTHEREHFALKNAHVRLLGRVGGKYPACTTWVTPGYHG
jgi:hypothetical protein